MEMARKNNVQMVDIKFVDTFGTWQHFSMPIAEVNEEAFTEGLGFDGSSIRGWKSIEASDMLAMPDPATAFIDPFCAAPTLSLTCTIAETGTLEPYIRDPRGISQRGEAYLQSTGVADTAYFGPEAEFFIFDNVQYDAMAPAAFFGAAPFLSAKCGFLSRPADLPPGRVGLSLDVICVACLLRLSYQVAARGLREIIV